MNPDQIKEESKPSVDEEATEAAATALTALYISSKNDEEDGVDAFEIPQRFTKSGRKRATPFPLKVSYMGCGPVMITVPVIMFLHCASCAHYHWSLYPYYE